VTYLSAVDTGTAIPIRFVSPLDAPSNIYYGSQAAPSIPVVKAASQFGSFGPKLRNIEIENTFDLLEKRWKRETMNVSSLHDMFLHPAYARIIGLGTAAIPLILRTLAIEPNYWFFALESITGYSPVRKKDAGNLRAMTDAWLRWGKKNGFYDAAKAPQGR